MPSPRLWRCQTSLCVPHSSMAEAGVSHYQGRIKWLREQDTVVTWVFEVCWVSSSSRLVRKSKREKTITYFVLNTLLKTKQKTQTKLRFFVEISRLVHRYSAKRLTVPQSRLALPTFSPLSQLSCYLISWCCLQALGIGDPAGFYVCICCIPLNCQGSVSGLVYIQSIWTFLCDISQNPTWSEVPQGWSLTLAPGWAWNIHPDPGSAWGIKWPRDEWWNLDKH